MKNQRLAPSSFHSRWYHLLALRDAIIEESKAALSSLCLTNIILIDFGCGTMPYREIFEPIVDQYIGVDLSDNFRADLNLNQNGKVPLNDASVDIVLSSQVLEHVSCPQLYLQEANRLLKIGGVLILSTHGYWMYHPDPNDFWRWTIDGLRKEIENANFQIEHVRGVMNLSASGLQLFQDGISKHIPFFLRPFFYWAINRLMSIVDKLGSAEDKNNDACVFVVMAVKKKGL